MNSIHTHNTHTVQNYRYNIWYTTQPLHTNKNLSLICMYGESESRTSTCITHSYMCCRKRRVKKTTLSVFYRLSISVCVHMCVKIAIIVCCCCCWFFFVAVVGSFYFILFCFIHILPFAYNSTVNSKWMDVYMEFLFLVKMPSRGRYFEESQTKWIKI